jgi:hypothetical protein
MNKIVKTFNNLLKKTLLKVQNKTNNKFKISTFNKFLISFIGILFFYIFYLLIPLLYDKSWIKDNIESKLLSEFKISLSFANNFSYRILPSPHFLIKDSKILLNNSKSQKTLADVENLKIFISKKNFFNKKKIDIKNIVLNYANFNLLRSDLKLLNNSSNNQFSHKKIRVNKSKIFLKDNLDEIITIINIDNSTLFFDDKKLLNLFSLEGNAFTIPFTFNLKNKNKMTKKKEITFEARSLDLNISNESFKKQNKVFTGMNIISFFNSIFYSKYEIEDEIINFESTGSRINNSKINYNGKLSINPFDLDLNVYLNNYKISKLFNFNPILKELLKSELLFNENISLNTSIIVNSDMNDEFFNSTEIYLSILNGKISFNNTKFINNKIGSVELRNSNLFLINNNLILNTDLLFDIKNSNNLFSFLNTSKRSRKEIKNILVNLEYDFFSNEIKFNKVEIDNNKVSDQFLNIIDGFQDNDSNNLIRSRILLNKLLNVYEG